MINVVKKYVTENKKEAAAVFVICAVALILRLISLLYAKDLSVDEIYSFYFSNKNSFFDVIKTLYNEDLHTPLYFILLHFWIKIFNIFGVGENDTVMRLLGFIPAFLTVPLAFYSGKKLFNSKTGYFAAIMLTLSPFAIFYTTELRFYGFAFFFALLSSFSFVNYINSINSNKEHLKKYKTVLIISNLALLYTFNISFIFVFFQFLCGMAFAKDKQDCFKAYLITGLLYIPGFIMTAHGIFAYKNSICSFAEDIFIYKPAFFGIFLQSFFSGNFFYASNNLYDYNDFILQNIFRPKQFFTILFPVIFCLAGFFKAGSVLFKNKTLILFLTPALLFLIFEFTFAHLGLMSLTVRYTLITYAIIIISCAFGFSLFKREKLIYALFALFLVSISYFIFSKKENTIKKETALGSPVQEAFLQFNTNKNDYVLAPIMGKLYKRYLPKNVSYIDFEVTDMLLNDVRKYFPYVFDEKTLAILNRKNARSVLKDFVLDENINQNIENFLKTQCFDKMIKGQAFIVAVYDINTVKDLRKLYNGPQNKREALYNKGSLYYMLSSKITLDVLKSANKHLKPLKYVVLNDKKNLENNTGIFIFIKD